MRDSRIAVGMASMGIMALAFSAISMLPSGPPASLPWPLVLAASAVAARTGWLVARQACGMSPLAWACFTLAGEDPAEALSRSRARSGRASR